MRKRVLVTGAAGFLGSHVVEYLLDQGHDVLAVDGNRLNMHGDPLKRLRHLGKNLNYMKVNLADLDSIDNNLVHYYWKPQWIVNLASDSHVDRSIREPRDVWINNTNLIVNMLEYAHGCDDLECFLQFSTDEVYGPSILGKEPWAPIYPSNPYSASKAAQEALVFSYWRTYDMPVCILNGTNIIGERQHPEKFLPKIIHHLQRGEPVPIYGDNSDPANVQTGTRNYTDVRAVCRAIDTALQQPVLTHDNGWGRPNRWHVAGPKQLSNLEMLKLVADAMDISLKPEHYKIVPFYKARPGHDISYCLNTDSLRALGWQHSEMIEFSIKRIVKWFLSNGAWLNEPIVTIS